MADRWPGSGEGEGVDLRSSSGCSKLVAAKQPTEALGFDNLAGGGGTAMLRHDELVAESLVRTLAVEMDSVFAKASPQ